MQHSLRHHPSGKAQWGVELLLARGALTCRNLKVDFFNIEFATAADLHSSAQLNSRGNSRGSQLIDDH